MTEGRAPADAKFFNFFVPSMHLASSTTLHQARRHEGRLSIYPTLQPHAHVHAISCTCFPSLLLLLVSLFVCMAQKPNTHILFLRDI
jgi:hypothetical protein